MAYHDDLKRALITWLGRDNVTFMPGWDKKHRGIGWKGTGAVPVALLVHHTAGAQTSSTDPKHPGNSKSADKGQADYVQNMNPSGTPGANFTLGRSGHLWVHSAYPVWHSGVGSFRGKSPYDSLGVPDDKGADYMLGCECVSKGQKKDFTSKEKWALGYLANACRQASGWKGLTKRLPRHKDWTTRKIDVLYPGSQLRTWATNAAEKKG